MLIASRLAIIIWLIKAKYSPMPTYSDAQLRNIAFPIGGIGTGNFSVSGNGSLLDWEIFHRPNKGSLMPNTFFSLWTRTASGKVDARVLESRQDLPLIGDTIGYDFYGHGHGIRRETGIGLRHVKKTTFRGEYPFAWVDFEDKHLPVEVSMMAYNPLIPLNVEDSGIPAGIIEFTITNHSAEAVELSLAGNLYNSVGYRGHGPFNAMLNAQYVGSGERNVNQFVSAGGVNAINMTSEVYTPDKPFGGTMALATPWQSVSYTSAWLRAGWYDALQYFWDEFSVSGRLTDRVYAEPTAKNYSDTASLALHASVAPGQTVRLPFYITWHFPNFIKYWKRGFGGEREEDPPMWRVPYANRFRDALSVAQHLAANEGTLRQQTEAFHRDLFSSTVPAPALDAISSQISTLKTNVVTLLEDGTLYGWEGVHSTGGSCEGSCEHVWNYALTHAYLYPSLERSMRYNDYTYNQWDDGRMSFRLMLPLGVPRLDYHPAADGQMGGIIQMYRDWKLSGDTDWLRSLWPNVRAALDYAGKFWDYNRDGVMEGLQHNTYDIEFYGPNSMMEGWYLGALRCGVLMAEGVGDTASAARYRDLADRGAKWMDENLFNGEYYDQHVDPSAVEHSPTSTEISAGGQRVGNPKYQYGAGCLSDQLVGAWLARGAGVDTGLDQTKVRKSLESIFRYNFRENLEDHDNAQRIYAVEDEPGLLLCTWPRGQRPDLPFVYSDEVWTGIEYQVAGHLIYEGMVEEGLKIVAGVRARYTGERRNPWSELECGNHYSRAMASWSVLLALSGFDVDMTTGYLAFAPAVKDQPFQTFWSTGTGWGTYRQDGGTASLTLDYGTLPLRSWRVGAKVSTVTLGGKTVAATVTPDGDGTLLTFAAPVTLNVGDILSAN